MLKNAVVFGTLAVLYAAFIFLVHPYFTPVLPLFNWAILGKLLLVLAPLFILYAWQRRSLMIPQDYHMLYLPFVIWLAATIVIKVVTWHFFQGRGVLGPYGGDKGLANMMIEIELVFLLSGMYLLRFVIARRRPESDAIAVARRLRSVILVGMVLVALLVPPLPD